MARPKTFNEKSKANLIPWKPGQSGNPSGRPKRRPISDWYAKVIDSPLPEELRKRLKLKRGATYGQAVAIGQIVAAVEGKAPNASEVREAIEGKAPQRIEVSGVEDGPSIQVETAERVDVSRLTKEDLLAYRAILRKAGAPRRDS